MNETRYDEYTVKAGGFNRQLELFSTFFGLRICQLIFTPTEQFSHTLQGKGTTIQEARENANVTELYLRNQRTDDGYDNFLSCGIAV